MDSDDDDDDYDEEDFFDVCPFLLVYFSHVPVGSVEHTSSDVLNNRLPFSHVCLLGASRWWS